MSRLPEIGDHVWREVDGKVTFDGYVYGTPYDDRSTTTLAPNDATFDTRGNIIAADLSLVSTLFLVRRLHGWRWVPHDFRPQVAVGDIIEGMLSESPDPKFKHSNVICAGLVRGRLLITAISDYGVNVLWLGGPPVVNEEPAFLDGQNVAKAIAGLDGWRWIPAGWPGEPKGVESRDQKQDAAPAPEPDFDKPLWMACQNNRTSYSEPTWMMHWAVRPKDGSFPRGACGVTTTAWGGDYGSGKRPNRDSSDTGTCPQCLAILAGEPKDGDPS